MDLGLAGKHALVTGSTAGIGYAIAKGLAAEGASVIVTGRTKATVDAAVTRIRQDGARGAQSTGIARTAPRPPAPSGVRPGARSSTSW